MDAMIKNHVPAVTPSGAAPVTLAYGDGIGPEIMKASLKVLLAGGAKVDFEPISIGEQAYLKGCTSGIPDEAWDSLRRTGVLYKAPITTPQGGGYKSLNVTIRKALGLFPNVRPCVAYAPFVATHHPTMDVVIIRENEEDLYAGIEHRQTHEVYQCLKLVTRPGCEKIIRYAFDYALTHGRRKVTCFSKDNIMKLTDGLFHKVFDEIGANYPAIEREHMIIDIGAAKLATAPERFDVIVTLNLYGDIISDIAAEVAGSVGLAGSANIGSHGAMFEAIHGSAPDIAGSGSANPSGLLHAGILMLLHLNQHEAASRIHNALLATIEDGIHTRDIYREGLSRKLATTDEFADAIIQRLGVMPSRFAPKDYPPSRPVAAPPKPVRGSSEHKELKGIDVFVQWDGHNPDHLAQVLMAATDSCLKLEMITNRGVKVWPNGLPETFHSDHWRCRFTGVTGRPVTRSTIVNQLQKLAAEKVDFIKTEHLYTFDGVPGYSLGQGQ